MRLYRYEEFFYYGGAIKINLVSYDVIKETKCGAWISVPSVGKRFVNLNARKQYACRTVEEASLSFKFRKQRQRDILTARLEQVEKAIKLFGEMGAVE